MRGRNGTAAYGRALSGLGRSLLAARPDLRLTEKGAVATWRDNLLARIDPAWFQKDLEAGDGRELAGKFRAAHSSSALAVNTFAPFKAASDGLRIAGKSGFASLQFEAKCSAGILGRRPPNLDLLLIGPSEVVGIESKCTEHLSRRTPKFADAYFEQIVDWRRDTRWFRLMESLATEKGRYRRYRHLDAAQLVKHAFGLGLCFADREVTLLYLYWEPRDAEDFAELRRHREETAMFAADVAGSRPAFKAMSYRDLWRSWDGLSSPAWLPQHRRALTDRYDIRIGGGAPA